MEDMAKSVSKKGIFASVKDIVPKISNLMDGSLKPELALGVEKGLVAKAENMNSSTNQNHNSVTFDNRGLLDGAVFYVREESDISKLAKQIKDYEESKNSNRYPWERR